MYNDIKSYEKSATFPAEVQVENEGGTSSSKYSNWNRRFRNVCPRENDFLALERARRRYSGSKFDFQTWLFINFPSLTLPPFLEANLK